MAGIGTGGYNSCVGRLCIWRGAVELGEDVELGVGTVEEGVGESVGEEGK